MGDSNQKNVRVSAEAHRLLARLHNILGASRIQVIEDALAMYLELPNDSCAGDRRTNILTAIAKYHLIDASTDFVLAASKLALGTGSKPKPQGGKSGQT